MLIFIDECFMDFYGFYNPNQKRVSKIHCDLSQDHVIQKLSSGPGSFRPLSMVPVAQTGGGFWGRFWFIFRWIFGFLIGGVKLIIGDNLEHAGTDFQ
jgi:hypothetical protein